MEVLPARIWVWYATDVDHLVGVQSAWHVVHKGDRLKNFVVKQFLTLYHTILYFNPLPHNPDF